MTFSKNINFSQYIKSLSEALSTDTPLKSKEMQSIQDDPEAWAHLMKILSLARRKGLGQVKILINGSPITIYVDDYSYDKLERDNKKTHELA